MNAFVITAVVLALLAAAGAWWLWRKLTKKHGPPACGKCGYPVGALETFTCPECGSDLRRVGIRAGSSAIPPAAWMVVAWSLGLLLVALPASVTVIGNLPSVSTVGGTISLRSPLSKAYRGITIDYEGSGTGAVKPDQATLTVDIGQPVVKQLTLNKPPITEGKHPRSQFEGLLASAGVDVSRADVQLEIDEIEACTEDSFAGKVLSVSTRSFSSSVATRSGTTKPIWWTIATGLIWAGVWLLGTWWILSRALRQRLTAPQATSPKTAGARAE